MSNMIETITNRRELERVEVLNKAAEAEAQAAKAETDALMGQLARRERQRAHDAARVQMETELHKAEQHIRAKYGNAPDLPPASHPEDTQAARRRDIMRGLLGKVLPKD